MICRFVVVLTSPGRLGRSGVAPVVLLLLTSVVLLCAAVGACSMPCYHPLVAYRTSKGEVVFGGPKVGAADELLLPCGRCVGCRLERSRQWAARIMFEAQMHDASSFVTLTYDDAHVPFPPSLDYSHFQRFLKRLRRRVGACRFYAVGEYGPVNLRPHFHACLFGVDFSGDRVPWLRRPGGIVYRSPLLESLWPLGYSSVAELSFETAAYCARYILDKVTGDLAQSHYQWTDVETGEVYDRVPEMSHMSLKPGIGGAWFDRYYSDVYGDHDFVVVNGRVCKPPRYFDKLFARLDPAEMEYIKSDRVCVSRGTDGSASRLVVREQVQLASLSRLTPRSL